MVSRMPKIPKPDKMATLGRNRNVTFVSPKKNQGRKIIKRKKKKQLKLTGKSLPALQAVVTGTQESCSLPPSVQGPLRGTLVVTIGQVDWRLPINPPEALAIRLRWWGESCHKTLYPPIIHEGQIIQSINTNPICSINYAIKSGPKQFKTYLQDTGSLMLDALEDSGKDKKIIAQGSIIYIESLIDKEVITDVVPMYDNKRRHLANLRVKAKLTMIGVLQKESNSVKDFNMIPSALNNDFPIPSLTKPKPLKQSRILRPDPELILSPEKESSFDDSPISIKSPHAYFPKHKANHDEVETLVNSTVKDSERLLTDLIEKGEALRNEIISSQDKLSADRNIATNTTQTLNLTDIDTVIGLLLPEDTLQFSNDTVPGEYNQFLEESLVRDSSLIEDILYMNGSSVSNRVLNEIEMEFGEDIEFNDSIDSPILHQVQTINKPIQLKTRKLTPQISDTTDQDSDYATELSYASIRDRLGQDRISQLERVFAAKVYIEKLIFNLPLDVISKPATPTQLSRIYRCTYIVEYQLEQQESMGNEKRRRKPEEETRVITRKVDGEGNIIFNHRTVVPLCLTAGVIKKWWNSKLEFKIYKKNLGQKKAIYLGVATLHLRNVLESDSLSMTSSLEVQVPSHLQREQYPTHLHALLELAGEPPPINKKKLIDKLDGGILRNKPSKETREKRVTFSASPPHTRDLSPHSPNDDSSSESETSSTPITITTTTTTADPLRLNLLLLVPDGSDISVASKECPWRGANPYLVLKIFCADTAPQSTVHWENGSPRFAFRQLFPIQLTHDTLTTKLCNKVAVLEVWHRETNRNRPSDELVGLVQLSLHQFYINFTHSENAVHSLQGQYPVISENGCYPITDPLTGKSRGYISALLALGSFEQISSLEQSITEGGYTIKTTSKKQIPYQEQDISTTALYRAQEGTYPLLASDHVYSEDSEHVFEICIEGAKDVHPLGSGVWGETDCYISYKFPISTRLSTQEQTPYTMDEQVELTAFSTPTTLSLPAPNFSAHHTHRLFLRKGTSLQQVLLDSTYQGMSKEDRVLERMPWRPQVEFELWRRYYYPDTQNHLLARGYLPTAKVCEMVTLVQHEGSFTVKTFTVPLHLAESEQTLTTQYTDNPNCGQLDLTIRYKLVKLDPEYSPTDPTIPPTRHHPQVYIKLQIKQATGLKDAVELAALSNTSISHSEVETGVNSYVAIRFSFTKKTHTTKAIAATFSPAFSYEIELPLSLSQSVIENHSPVSLAEILSKSTVNFQIWHVPLADRNSLHDRTHTQVPHVILGECSLPFEALLLKSTGVKGWYSLKPPNGKGNKCVGALDLNIEFSSIEDREKVMYEANKFGYQIERPVKFDSLQLEAEQNLEIDINIRRIWIAKQSHSTKPNNLCYLRYRFYDKTTTISPTFSPRRNEGSRVVYDTEYKKSCQVFPSSAFEWYLQEERFELQIWQTIAKSSISVKPSVDDNLIGTAYVNLYEMCGFRDFQEPQLAGVYPLFKAGVSSLGGNCAEIEIAIHQPTQMDLIENSTDTPLQDRSGLMQGAEIGDSEETFETETPSGIPIIFAVDRAAHLTSLPKPSGCLHVTVHGDVLLLQTNRIEISSAPIWNFQQEVHIREEIFSPMLGLEAKLWYSAANDAIQSQLIGVAKVDLSPLKYGLPELAGWYNLSNVMSYCQGQIKLRAIPKERMDIPPSVMVQHQKSEWKQIAKRCSLIDNPVVIQEVEIDLTGVDSNVTGSFLMRRLKSSLADLDCVQANLKKSLQPIQIPPPGNDDFYTETLIPSAQNETVFEDTTNMMGNLNALLQEIDELPLTIDSPQHSPTELSLIELSDKETESVSEELCPIQVATEDVGVNTVTFNDEEFGLESSELPLIEEMTFQRNYSPDLSEDDEVNSQETQIAVEENNSHFILQTEFNETESQQYISTSPKSLTDVSAISDLFEPENEQEKSENLLNWVDSMTRNIPTGDQLHTTEHRTSRIITSDEDGNLKINIPDDIQVPNFFMPPDTLIENMRKLRMKAMSQFPPATPKEDKLPSTTTKPPSVHLTAPLLPWEANRINKIFLGKV